MGKLLQGINGPFSGKVGTAVGYMWRDIPVIRSLPSTRNKPFTPKELNQQAKFKLMNQFLVPAKRLLDVTFAHLAVRMTGFNKAFSYNVKTTITGFLPELSIDYAMVLLSRGDLTRAESAVVSAPSPDTLQFSWTNNSGKGKALDTDQAFVAAFNPEESRWIYQLNVATRNAGHCTLDITKFSGKPLQTYIGFIAADGKDASDSVYTGLVNEQAN